MNIQMDNFDFNFSGLGLEEFGDAPVPVTKEESPKERQKTSPKGPFEQIKEYGKHMKWDKILDSEQYTMELLKDGAQRLGSGAYGVVYEHNGKAIKLINFENAPANRLAIITEETLQETIALKELTEHCDKYISRYIDVKYGDDKPFLVIETELIDGQDFGRISLSSKKLLHVASYLIQGLRCIHNYGVLHRDIHSSNIMVTKQASKPAVFIDFGLSCFLNKNCANTRGSPLALFWSPELLQQCNNNKDECIKYWQYNIFKRTEKDDIYALGLCFYEKIVGSIPWDKKDVAADQIWDKLNKMYKDGSIWKILDDKADDDEKKIIAGWIKQMMAYDANERDLPDVSSTILPAYSEEKKSLSPVIPKKNHEEQQNAVIPKKDLNQEKQKQKLIKDLKNDIPFVLSKLSMEERTFEKVKTILQMKIYKDKKMNYTFDAFEIPILKEVFEEELKNAPAVKAASPQKKIETKATKATKPKAEKKDVSEFTLEDLNNASRVQLLAFCKHHNFVPCTNKKVEELKKYCIDKFKEKQKPLKDAIAEMKQLTPEDKKMMKQAIEKEVTVEDVSKIIKKSNSPEAVVENIVKTVAKKTRAPINCVKKPCPPGSGYSKPCCYNLSQVALDELQQKIKAAETAVDEEKIKSGKQRIKGGPQDKLKELKKQLDDAKMRLVPQKNEMKIETEESKISSPKKILSPKKASPKEVRTSPKDKNAEKLIRARKALERSRSGTKLIAQLPPGYTPAPHIPLLPKAKQKLVINEDAIAKLEHNEEVTVDEDAIAKRAQSKNMRSRIDLLASEQQKKRKPQTVKSGCWRCSQLAEIGGNPEDFIFCDECGKKLVRSSPLPPIHESTLKKKTNF